MNTSDKQVVVVSGLPRSGTSLMMQMLEAGGIPPLTDTIRARDEDNPKGYYEHESIKQLQTRPDIMQQAVGRAVKVIHLLLEHLPKGYHYKILFMRRSLEEVVRSQRKMLERSGKQGAALTDAALMKVYENQLVKADELLRSRSDCEVLYIDHRTLIDNPLSIADQINTFLGGDMDVRSMASAVDPGLYRNRA